MSEKLDVRILLDKYKEWVDSEKIKFLKNSADREKISKQVEELKNAFFPAGDGEDRGDKDWYALHEAGTRLWHDLASYALNDIDENSKGNSQLFAFLKAATEFEDLLYGLEPYYRDHTLHSLWVYLIGEYILRELTPENRRGMNWYLYNDIDHDQKKYDYPEDLVKEAEDQEDKFVGRVEKHKDAIWCIIALCHDLGYSLEKLKNLNEKVQAVLKFYDVPDFKRVGYAIDVEHQYILSQFLELMAMDLRIVPSEDYWEIDGLKVRVDDEELTQHQYEKQLEQKVLIKCYRDDTTYWRLCRDLEKRQQVILSAYLIYKILDIFSDTSVRGPAEEWGLDDNEVAYNIIRGDILFAIAQHQFDFAHLNQLSSLADVLMLADELEEFSRYGRQLMSRKYFATTATAELSINKARNEGKKKYLEIVITYKSKHKERIDFLEFFWRKAKRICETYSLDLRKQEEEEEEEGRKSEIFRHEYRYYYIKNIKMKVKYKKEECYFYIDKNSDKSKAKLPKTMINDVKCKARTHRISCWDDNVIIHDIKELKDQKNPTLRDWIDGVKKLPEKKTRTPKKGS